MEVQLIDADLLSGGWPGVVHVVCSQLGAILSREDSRGRQCRAFGHQVRICAVECPAGAIEIRPETT
jgi:hypothetical protein